VSCASRVYAWLVCACRAFTLCPYTTLFRSGVREVGREPVRVGRREPGRVRGEQFVGRFGEREHGRAHFDQYRGRARYWSKCARRSEEHTSELQSLRHLVCRLLLEKKKKKKK